jgi:hypothetical protein
MQSRADARVRDRTEWHSCGLAVRDISSIARYLQVGDHSARAWTDPRICPNSESDAKQRGSHAPISTSVTGSHECFSTGFIELRTLLIRTRARDDSSPACGGEIEQKWPHSDIAKITKMRRTI